MNSALEALGRWSQVCLPVWLDAATKGAALLVLAGLVVAAMRRSSAAARQMVWVVALAAILAVPLVSAVLPAWQVLPGWAKFEMPVSAPRPADHEPETAGTPGQAAVADKNPWASPPWPNRMENTQSVIPPGNVEPPVAASPPATRPAAGDHAYGRDYFKALCARLRQAMPGDWQLDVPAEGNLAPAHRPKGTGVLIRMNPKGFRRADPGVLGDGEVVIWIMNTDYEGSAKALRPASPRARPKEVDLWHGHRVFVWRTEVKGWPTCEAAIKAALRTTAAPSATQPEEDAGSIWEHLTLGELKAIAVTHAPEGDFGAKDVRSVTTREREVLHEVAAILKGLPACGTIWKRFPSDIEQWRIDLHGEGGRKGVLRFYGVKLRSPLAKGGSFYSGRAAAQERRLMELIRTGMNPDRIDPDRSAAYEARLASARWRYVLSARDKPKHVRWGHLLRDDVIQRPIGGNAGIGQWLATPWGRMYYHGEWRYPWGVQGWHPRPPKAGAGKPARPRLRDKHQARKALLKDLDRFLLMLRYHGPADKQYHSLTLSVQPTHNAPQPFRSEVCVAREQARRIIHHLLDAGFLATAMDISGKDMVFPRGPAYTLTLAGRTMRLYDVLGWGLPMLRRLEGLRKALDGDAAKALDKLLARLEPHRREWQEAPATRPATEPAAVPPEVQKWIDALTARKPGEGVEACRQLAMMGEKAAAAVPAVAALLADGHLHRHWIDPQGVFEDIPVGTEAARALTRMGPAGVGALRAALYGGNATARENGAFALWRVRPAGVDILVTALKDADAERRLLAARALACAREPEVVQPLLDAFTDEDARVREAAVAALSGLWQGEPLEPLIVALKDREPAVRTAAARVLGAAGPNARAALDPLVATLRDRNDTAACAAARALGEVQNPRAVGALVAMLKRREMPRVAAAAQALVRIRDARGIDAVAQMLESPDRSRRGAAAEAFGSFCSARAVPGLAALLKDEERWVREAAATALAISEDACAVEPLIAALADTSLHVRWRAAQGLGRLKDRRAVEPLTACLTDDWWAVRESAAEALGAIGDRRAVPALIAALKREYRDPSGTRPIEYGQAQHRMRQRATAALKAITGLNFGEDAAKWEAWWNAQATSRPTTSNAADAAKPALPATRPADSVSWGDALDGLRTRLVLERIKPSPNVPRAGRGSRGHGVARREWWRLSVQVRNETRKTLRFARPVLALKEHLRVTHEDGKPVEHRIIPGDAFVIEPVEIGPGETQTVDEIPLARYYDVSRPGTYLIRFPETTTTSSVRRGVTNRTLPASNAVELVVPKAKAPRAPARISIRHRSGWLTTVTL